MEEREERRSKNELRKKTPFIGVRESNRYVLVPLNRYYRFGELYYRLW
jgi:hypothetical protein